MYLVHVGFFCQAVHGFTSVCGMAQPIFINCNIKKDMASILHRVKAILIPNFLKSRTLSPLLAFNSQLNITR